ncbi:hypothetical protein POM88_054401 [Heracleum sosnowskyi]|uniref:RRM domain-containing protein n=1 Tax=Heracleum sosnowskyi TaxID=360622 RepID=A0AAD8GMD9_9APIA|nr:hypothetical protein POM88_054401 [Heracleum sosnowskyi]
MYPSNSESLISSVSSTDENEKLSCSNGKVSREDWIVEWAKDNNNSLLQIVCSFYSMHFPKRGGEITFKPLEHLQTVKYRRPSDQKNFAFIQFKTQEDAIKALKATKMSKMMDRVMSVEYAIKDDEASRQA